MSIVSTPTFTRLLGVWPSHSVLGAGDALCSSGAYGCEYFGFGEE